MLVCWMEDPQRRPTFYELKEMMQDVVCQLRQGISGSSLLNNHYERVSPRSAATTPIAYTKPIAGPIITDLWPFGRICFCLSSDREENVKVKKIEICFK